MEFYYFYFLREYCSIYYNHVTLIWSILSEICWCIQFYNLLLSRNTDTFLLTLLILYGWEAAWWIQSFITSVVITVISVVITVITINNCNLRNYFYTTQFNYLRLSHLMVFIINAFESDLIWHSAMILQQISYYPWHNGHFTVLWIWLNFMRYLTKRGQSLRSYF